MLQHIYLEIYNNPRPVFLIILVWIFLCGLIDRKVALKKNFICWIWKGIVFLVFAFCLGIFLYAAFGRRYPTVEAQYQLHLFWSYEEAFVHDSAFMREQIFWNIFAFVPIGHALNCLWTKKRKWWKVFFCAFLISLSVELTQLFLHIGLFELDDMFHNVLGGMIGYGVAEVVRRMQGGKHT